MKHSKMLKELCLFLVLFVLVSTVAISKNDSKGSEASGTRVTVVDVVETSSSDIGSMDGKSNGN